VGAGILFEDDVVLGDRFGFFFGGERRYFGGRAGGGSLGLLGRYRRLGGAALAGGLLRAVGLPYSGGRGRLLFDGLTG
jgi:hypothetical protein